MKKKFQFPVILYGILLVMLSFPLIQANLNPVKLKPLNGAFVIAKDTVLTPGSWLSGRYQAQEEKAVNDSFGFRNFFIRLNNQIDYNLFSKTHTADIIIGKNGELYGDDYINAYTGADFIGEDSIKKRLDELNLIQHYMDSLHKLFIIIFAPSKVRLQPEYLPDEYKYTQRNNYEIYAKLAPEMGLNVIDFDKYFTAIKTTSKYPLYPQKGTHWSRYGACLAADSIVSYIENKKHIKMLHTNWQIILPEEAKGDELELESEMNLIFSLNREILGHPQISIPKDSTAVKPALLYIGDSYFWNMVVHYNFWNPFLSLTFCYYYREIFPAGGSKISADQFDLAKEIKKSDIIIIEATETNLSALSWDFAPEVLKLIHSVPISDSEYRLKLTNLRNAIKADPAWLKTVEKKAKKNNVTLDSMLTIDAIWVMEHPGN